ncbi:MAG TPA: hypothetical protein VFM53_07850 [Anaeromyxobacteraceae bacterium]|nr:hypothetical protein [Anaeromyxobacteraceae bacterium]
MPDPATPGPQRPADPAELARSATLDELQRMKVAEELHQLQVERTSRRSQVATFAQVVVGFVALAGLAVNAYQSWSNKQQQEHRDRAEAEKWTKEFARASQADKYRAFFETSMLATDSQNADKRLVGYALLQEFVRDPAYDEKAMIMLEESLSQELKGSPKARLDETRRAAVGAILTSLAGTDDCRVLQRAARSVDRVARFHARTRDDGETREVVDVYVRRLVGRAALVCGSLKDFKAVRLPIRDTMLRNPELLGLNEPTEAEANLLMAAILRQACEEELSYSGASDCPDILRAYAALCEKGARDAPEDRAACGVIQEAAAALPRPGGGGAP